MKTIPLTQGKFAIVDDEDFEELSKYKWYAQKATLAHLFYARRNVRKRLVIDGEIYWNSKWIFMHRHLMKGIKQETFVDHADNDTLNNQKGNLREATVVENMRNRRSKGTSTSKHKGVNQRGASGQFRAAIHVGDKIIALGTFETEEDAAVAYNIAAKKYHGAFANLNKVDTPEGYEPKRHKHHKTPKQSSIYRGVCFVKDSGNWQASLRVDNKTKHIGTYKTEEDAARAYNEYTIKHKISYASLNEIKYN